jgi:two-component sensor histidine kinase
VPNRSSKPSPDETIRRLAEYQRILGALSRFGTEAATTTRLLQHACALVARATRIRHVKALRYRPDQADLLMEAGVGWREGVVGQVALSVDMASPAGRALQTAQPVVIHDIAAEPDFISHPTLVEHGIVSLMNVPIMIDGQTWGVLEVDAQEQTRFDDFDVSFLATLANVIGAGVQHREMLTERESLLALQTADRERARLLLEELQHRVKNNFQVILSFLALQRRHVPTEELKSRFSTVMDRVLAIALAHDQLSQADHSGSVDFGDYLKALCKNIDPRRENVAIHVAATSLVLPLDRAVPAGLIVNELVSNAYKHAFCDKGGTVRVAFEVHPEIGEAMVVVEDDGRGMSAAREGGMGLRLIETFAVQLNGHVEQENAAPGTRTRVWFPLPL